MAKKSKLVEKETRRLMESISDMVKKRDGRYQFKKKHKKKQIRRLRMTCVHWIYRKGREIPTVITDPNDHDKWRCTICGATFPVRPMPCTAGELKNHTSAYDKQVLERLGKVKRENKAIFADYLAKATGQVIDPDSIFDCQVKRMHEYKRQHLNALNIAAQYLYLKANPNADFTPKTYIFGAKAAPGYYMAKQMIRLICKLGQLIDSDPAVRDKLRIVYLEDYCVSLSERLMPASEVSEQISLAGTEASGTGNMKFMLNGAITLGTLDGANVEIADAAGRENEIIFGMLTPEVNALKGMGYHPSSFIYDDDVAMAVLDMLEKGWNGENFSEVTNNLRNSDPYMVMADFKDYRRAQADVQRLYADRETWNRMSLMNIANSGVFSADRSVMDYARNIWGITPVK